MPTTVWFCEGCKRNGSIVHDEEQSAYSMIYQIGDKHREKAPKCLGEPRCLILEADPQAAMEYQPHRDLVRWGTARLKRMAALTRSPEYELPADSHIDSAVGDIIRMAQKKVTA